MDNKKIAFVGGGNMTRAIVSGLLADGFDAAAISIAEPVAAQRVALSEDFPGITVGGDNEDIVTVANVVVLAVKPQVLAAVCQSLNDTVSATRPLIISIAAGVRIGDIDQWLGGGQAVVRVMPNQPALLRQGVSGLFANSATDEQQIQTASTIMSAVGQVVAVGEESDIDTVTAISGSGPAYFYLLIDMLAQTARDLGLNEDSAVQLAVGTARGATALAAASDESMSSLIEKVRSPGGTTAAALDSLQQQGVRDIFSRALVAARDRAVELADQAHQFSQD